MHSVVMTIKKNAHMLSLRRMTHLDKRALEARCGKICEKYPSVTVLRLFDSYAKRDLRELEFLLDYEPGFGVKDLADLTLRLESEFKPDLVSVVSHPGWLQQHPHLSDQKHLKACLEEAIIVYRRPENESKC
jgi:hypothetical protein